ncbi:type IV pilus minor pilin MshD, putative [Syntrophotalea carbinolica DSM 2380]|uniref:Type IV pilus minor pilin MshD, putative n=2 Tax=Syntrophotalea carbinolica TaxID=19 RepID=Q3A7J1_SYNC1|nr:type IV pilus minor pilin MshD, putative [Syntrophotalea carbinolica DSM 2380]
MTGSGKHSGGFTLIELVVSMVVVSIALGGVLMVMNYTVQHSADPMLQHQAVAIAESYLEEVLLRSYADPDGSDGETVRSLLDDVDDYDGWADTGACDQEGTAITGLESYTVSVAVDDAVLNTVACKKVTVTVSHPTGINLKLSGYRTNY